MAKDFTHCDWTQELVSCVAYLLQSFLQQDLDSVDTIQ